MGEKYAFNTEIMRIVLLAAFSFDTTFRHFHIDSYNILWYIRIIQLFVHRSNGVSEHVSDRTRC